MFNYRVSTKTNVLIFISIYKNKNNPFTKANNWNRTLYAMCWSPTTDSSKSSFFHAWYPLQCKKERKKPPPNQLGNKEKIKVYLLMHDLHRVLSKSYPLSLSSTSRISNLTILAIQGSILRIVLDLDSRSRCSWVR